MAEKVGCRHYAETGSGLPRKLPTGSIVVGVHGSVPRNHFIQIQQHICRGGPCGKFRDIKIGRTRSLKWSVGSRSFKRAFRSIWSIEDHEGRIRRSASPERVESSAIKIFSGADTPGPAVVLALVKVGGLIWKYGRPAHLLRQQTCRRQRVVTHDFCLQPNARSSPEHFVLGIKFCKTASIRG